jgi:metal-responsive CopG/Arc/MetJ family transcriptional regulator
MVNTGVTVPKELLDDFDEVVWQLEVEGELPRDVSRSQVIQYLMQDFVDEHRELLDGEDAGKQTPANTVLAD